MKLRSLKKGRNKLFLMLKNNNKIVFYKAKLQVLRKKLKTK